MRYLITYKRQTEYADVRAIEQMTILATDEADARAYFVAHHPRYEFRRIELAPILKGGTQ